MDTGSHLLFGATLAGLATLHSGVAHDGTLFAAVLTVAMIGSHAPDFDTLARMKGYNAYIRIHRGVTHSLPALVLWPLLLSLLAGWGFGLWPHLPLLFLVGLAAVGLHVFLDWLNAYGVQCLRPFCRRWRHLDVLPLFDPVLFTMHGAGLLYWVWGGERAGAAFLWIYGATALYIVFRIFQQQQAVRHVRKELLLEGACYVVPGLHPLSWQFVMETEEDFYTGTVRGTKVRMLDVYPKGSGTAGPVVQATMTTDGVRAFLGFAQRVHVQAAALGDGYLVQWRDMRFWHNHQLPFGVDVRLDSDLKVVSQSLGWRKKAWDPPFV
ncbi:MULTISPECIES: metal-dependent hydrolase [Paenibacillus]|uniref:metal-dependent hydrolase n=1 Tax=Paenibacillus TaxID=44249 RepID=UPI0022B915B6|nr:metal-dependent hydrolase [Paenibacillus caseinilyticus]MCZ8521497.1 metal-dependent hydrolase [Paenibacillus caseinilyticus]